MDVDCIASSSLLFNSQQIREKEKLRRKKNQLKKVEVKQTFAFSIQ
jgi:uncharacterized membrane protein